MLHLKRLCVLAILFFCALEQGTNVAFSQIQPTNNKADKYYNNFEFNKAIPLYKKSANKNDSDLRKLADCYRLAKNYQQAEIYYGKLASKESSDSSLYYYYGEVLLNNNKYEEAKKQFKKHAILNPADSKGKLYAQACDNIQTLLIKPAVYNVYNLGKVNSSVSDFCPTLYQDGLVFASERIKDRVTDSENNWTGNSYLSLVFARGIKEKDSVIYDKGKPFSEKFAHDEHYGPVCFNNDYSEMYFTKVDNFLTRKQGVVSFPKIYWSKYNRGWSKPKPLPFNNNGYMVAHPSLSKDGQTLYFTSTMPGGQGGSDIYMVKREGNTWGQPQNLGAAINTAENESFPHIDANDVLYFSSNGHTGFGGLDLFFTTQKDGKWFPPNNMLPPINSTSDDFGLVIKDDISGYFSSDRSGGLGSDDLYSFSLSGFITSISGKILLSSKINDGAQNIKIFLFTNNGILLQTIFTDGSGFFKFDNLPADQSYMIRLDENDSTFVNQKKIYLADTKNKLVRVIVRGKNGFFIFENLPSDLSTLSQLTEEDPMLQNFSIAGNLYAGEQRVPIENTKVNLINDKGEKIQSTTTNSFGSFVFTNISSDKNFIIALDTDDPKLIASKIYLTNKSGKEISLSQDRTFKFELLASDKNTLSQMMVKDSELLLDFKGALFSDKNGKIPIADSKIKIVNEKGETIGYTTTDANGNFKFINLPADQNYIVQLEENDPTLMAKDVFLADTKGKVITTMKLASGKFFQFRFLPTDERSLSSIYFDDPWLKVAGMQSKTEKDSMRFIFENLPSDRSALSQSIEEDLTLQKSSIAGNLYAGEERKPIGNTKVSLMNDKGEKIQTTTTNASGAFVFMNIPPDKNLIVTLDTDDPVLTLSKIYLTNKNGKEIGLSQDGKFNFQLLASDKNTLSLMSVEDNDLLFELKGTLFSDKDGKMPIANSKIKIVNDKGEIIGHATTDANGNFKLINLPTDQNYIVKLEEDDPTLMAKDVYLADTKGKVITALKSADGNFFQYQLLPMDKQTLGSIYVEDPTLGIVRMQGKKKDKAPGLNDTKPQREEKKNSESRLKSTNAQLDKKDIIPNLKDSKLASEGKDSMISIVENIYYGFNKWNILPEASITLNKVVDVLRKNPEITIEIISHTDSRGHKEYNSGLSKKRAQSAVIPNPNIK
ncbi:MAG: OmpA family protein [Bacteroidota bacterium]